MSDILVIIFTHMLGYMHVGERGGGAGRVQMPKQDKGGTCVHLLPYSPGQLSMIGEISLVYALPRSCVLLGCIQVSMSSERVLILRKTFVSTL